MLGNFVVEKVKIKYDKSDWLGAVFVNKKRKRKEEIATYKQKANKPNGIEN